ncbi:DUF397 domain-containing protein [Paractinoplanes brasiliensis]|uniref:Uncharacterized protein DUF397 n=1 Tax=Paractinoplanes brasiliensis TaxID=52695 RepID=A0A4R6JUB6_9ACTN|nr:DUF397 domain-containing protein [Actinoplanes brasiliensis]TDO38245.1 uncharacterized protein DUF397 [Actinoplanes brasiliensis]GID26978.1 hypothetical protein Abr02nite_19610 [Actinoplanes brasiliensis]
MDNETAPGWHKSRRSSTGNCVEIKREGEQVLMRDTKDRSGPVLTFDIDAFRAFIAELKDERSPLTALDSD